MGRRILIAGVAGHWGTQLARRLEAAPEVDFVCGVDTRAPAGLGTTRFIEADIRNPVISRLLPGTEVDTVVHCGIVWYPEPGVPARALHDINVIGTLQLLAACERIPTLKSLVVRGSAAIYGSEAAGPSFFTEDMARRYPLRTRFQRDIGELESYVESFAHRHPETTCCVLRHQPEIGSDLDTPVSRYLSLPVVPTQLGFDPRLQFVHPEDAIGALRAATMRPVRGPVNVAPSGSVSLTKMIRLAGRRRLPVPHQLFGSALAGLGQQLGLADLYGDAVQLLRNGRGVDNTRLRVELGFQPAFDAVSAARDFARGSGRPAVPPPEPRVPELTR